MAIKSNSFVYNGKTYSEPYFRINSHFNLGENVIAIDIHMWESREDYKGNLVEDEGLYFSNKKPQIASFPFYLEISKSEVPGHGLANDSIFLNFVSEKVVEHLKGISSSSSFEILDIE